MTIVKKGLLGVLKSNQAGLVAPDGASCAVGQLWGHRSAFRRGAMPMCASRDESFDKRYPIQKLSNLRVRGGRRFCKTDATHGGGRSKLLTATPDEKFCEMISPR